MTSSNGNIFHVTGPLCGPWWIPRQWRGALMFSLICARIDGLVNNGEAGDLGRHCAHYDVIVMFLCLVVICFALLAVSFMEIWYCPVIQQSSRYKNKTKHKFMCMLYGTYCIYERHFSPVHVWVILHNLLTQMLRCFKSLATWLVVQQFVKVTTKKTPFSPIPRSDAFSHFLMLKLLYIS